MRAHVRNTIAPWRATIRLNASPDLRSRNAARSSASPAAGVSVTFALI
jgi:hypothetical protein